MMLMLPVTSCGIAKVNDRAVCDGTKRYVDRHADSLLGRGVPDSVVITGASLIAAIDAACGV